MAFDPLEFACPVLFGAVDRAEPNHRYQPQVLSHYAIVGTLAGSATAVINGQTTIFPERSVAILNPGVELQETAGPEGWTVPYLILDGPWAKSLDRFGPFTVLPRRVHAVALLAQCATSPPSERVSPLLDLLQIIHSGINRGERLPHGCLKRPDGSYKDADELAQDLGVSIRTIHRRVRQECGVSFAEWREQAWVRDAQDSLRQRASVSWVAERIGFSSASAFSRAYLRATGRRPSEEVRPRDVFLTINPQT